MLMAMFAWVLRFGLFGAGNPGTGVWMFVLSCIVYGFAFDFFNISGALYVDQETSPEMRSSAQGLFMMMTNGVGATIGTLSAQAVVNKCVPTIDWSQWISEELNTLKDNVIQWGNMSEAQLSEVAAKANEVWVGWQEAWYIFAAYALVVAILFWIFFPKTPVKK